VQLHPRQLRKDQRGVLQGQPIELEVVPGGEVPVPPAVGLGHLGQGAQLVTGEQAIGDRNPQHGPVAQDIESVEQAQGPQVLGTQGAGAVTPELIAQLGHSRVHQLLIVGVVVVHGRAGPWSAVSVAGEACSARPRPAGRSDCGARP
jgi:hypothetical protein